MYKRQVGADNFAKIQGVCQIQTFKINCTSIRNRLPGESISEELQEEFKVLVDKHHKQYKQI